MIIKKEITINSNIEKCWDVLGKEFANAYKWASAIKHSEGIGGNFNGSSCSIRACEVKGMGALKEKLLEYSDETHSLRYRVVEGMPSMVKKGSNSWKLLRIDANKTKLTMEMNMEIAGIIGTMMKPMMKLQMNNMGKQLTEEFKFYIENGTAHSRKTKAI